MKPYSIIINATKKVIPVVDTILTIYTVSSVMMGIFRWYERKHGKKTNTNKGET